jgi:hypothetical protein
MKYYYLEKDTSSVPVILSWVQSSRLLENNVGALDLLTAFFSIIFSDHPESVVSWLKEIDFSGQAQKCMRKALALSRLSELDGEIFSDNHIAYPPMEKHLLDKQIESPGDIDMMWGAFQASGDTRYVNRIIDVLDDTVALSGADKLDAELRGVAAKSLESNLFQHELVHRCIRMEIDKRGKAIRKSLVQIERENMKYATPFSKSDGEFSAMLVIIDEKELAEFTKPTNDTMYFNEQAHAKRGDVLAIKVMFGGMALTDDLHGDVAFDLKILDPKGDIYDSTDIKGLAALDYKVPTRFAIYDNRNYATIRFEPNDLLGTYQFHVVMHDKVGLKDIVLSKKVKVSE